MKVELRNACLSAAVFSVLYGSASVQARDLIWDPTGVSGIGTDGAGQWDTLNTNWVDTAALGVNTIFVSSPPDSATFGTSTTAIGAAAPFNVILNSDVTVNNLTLATASTGAYYNVTDQSDNLQTLTVAGNIIKSGATGTGQFQLANSLALTGGNHTIAVRDTPGDVPELTFNNGISGTGALIIDTTLNYAGAAADVQYGTVTFTQPSNYSGGTLITSGRLISNNSAGLGTGLAEITNAGQLSFGGAGTATGAQTISTPIKISRSDYSSSTSFSRFTDAIIAVNDGSNNTITFNGGFDVASTDARIAAFTNKIVIDSNITSSTGNGVLSVEGDFAGYVRLNGNNTGLAVGGIRINAQVEVEATTDANLGGPNSPITFLGGGSFHPIGGVLTDFGTHVINSTTFNGGIDIDDGKSFTVSNLSGVSIGKRGTGTLNLNGTNVFTGVPFYDAGVVNVNGATTFSGFRLRQPTVNINNGATLTTTGAFSDIGFDANDGGTGVVNVNTGGKLVAANQDFNISDNAGSKGTLNIANGGVATIAGTTFLGKVTNAVGTMTVAAGGSFTTNGLHIASNTNSAAAGTGSVTVTGTTALPTVFKSTAAFIIGGGTDGVGSFANDGGTVTATKTQQQSFVIGGGTRGIGTASMSSGSITVTGESWIGNNTASKGTYTQTGGTYTGNDWVAIGRGGALGTLNLSGGTFIKQGGNNMYVGETTNAVTSTMTVSNGATFSDIGGEFWVGQGGGIGILNIQDANTTFTVNNWLALGRQGGTSKGTINLSGGTLTKQGTNGNLAVGSGGTGTFNQTGGVLNSNATLIGEASNGTANLSGGTSTFTGVFHVGENGGVFGTLNLSGTANVTVPSVVYGSVAGTGGGTINLGTGATLTAASFASGLGTGAKAFNFNGGTLKPSVDTATFMGGLSTATVQAGGARIDTNARAITIAQPLLHDATLGATLDGGLTKSGSGTLRLTGANTYTGATVVAGGTVQATSAAYGNVLSNTDGLDVKAGKYVFDYSGATTPLSTVKTLLTAGYPGNFAAGQIRSSTATSAKGLGYADDGVSNVTVMATFYGDANLDGQVDFNDFIALQTNYLGSNTNWDQGNFNYDNVTDFNDFISIQTNYGQSVTGANVSFTTEQTGIMNAFFAANTTEVPEPASLAALAGGVFVLGSRRRRAATRV